MATTPTPAADQPGSPPLMDATVTGSPPLMDATVTETANPITCTAAELGLRTAMGQMIASMTPVTVAALPCFVKGVLPKAVDIMQRCSADCKCATTIGGSFLQLAAESSNISTDLTAVVAACNATTGNPAVCQATAGALEALVLPQLTLMGELVTNCKDPNPRPLVVPHHPAHHKAPPRGWGCTSLVDWTKPLPRFGSRIDMCPLPPPRPPSR